LFGLLGLFSFFYCFFLVFVSVFSLFGFLFFDLFGYFFLGFCFLRFWGLFVCLCWDLCWVWVCLVGLGFVYVVVFVGCDVSVLVGRFVRRLPAGAVYRERLARELRLIRDGGFVSVFVFVSDVLRLTGDIPHVVRGSAGGSLVCFLLGISDFDPVLYGVSLARFMHECRGDVPDIDIDFPYNRRDEVFERVFGFFGVDRVARISNRLHFRRRSSFGFGCGGGGCGVFGWGVVWVFSGFW
jgi:hypothetical protein